MAGGHTKGVIHGDSRPGDGRGSTALRRKKQTRRAPGCFRPMSEPELILKTTPPRLLRGVAKRERLHAFWLSARERAAILATAPAGFGKTTVLLQWRRQWLEQGALVAWLSADVRDE